MSTVSDPTVRRLSAVWFADIVGYVALSSEDEAEALEVVGIMQRLAREHIEACGGELIKFVGDAVLAAFGSTSAALRSALELRAAFAEATSQRGHELPLRIGLHVGDLSTSPDGDVYGDGVNLASRIQAAVEPGEVGVSGDVWRQLRSRREFVFTELGDEKLRGVPGRV
ncbi:MAG: adenylate/guanylate cyclase domain-containing protein, partial [Longimicrobiales bacterium]